jgi:hypothetical protein
MLGVRRAAVKHIVVSSRAAPRQARQFALRSTSRTICWKIHTILFVEDLAMTSSLLTLALLLPAAPVPAAKDTPPKGPAPRVVAIAVQSDGTPSIQHVRTRMVQQQRTRQVQVGQETRTVAETVMVPVLETVNLALDGESVEVYGADGKKLDPKDVRKQVTKPVAALVSADGKPVDPFYLRLAREGTLVIVVPMAAAGAAPKPPERRTPLPKP